MNSIFFTNKISCYYAKLNKVYYFFQKTMKTNIITFFFLLMHLCIKAQIPLSESHLLKESIKENIDLKTERIFLIKHKTKNDKLFYINDLDKIKVLTKADNIYSGNFKFMNNDFIQIDGKPIEINEIKKIKKPNKGLRIFGGIFGTLTAIVLPISAGGGDWSILIFEPIYASPLYLLGASKTFDLTKKFDLIILKSDH